MNVELRSNVTNLPHNKLNDNIANHNKVNRLLDLMDPINPKIIVTNSDAAYLAPPPSDIHSDECRNVNTDPANASIGTSDNLQSNHQNVMRYNTASTLKSSNRWNLPPLKMCTNEQKSFKLPSDDDQIDENIIDDSQKLLLSPLLSKSLTTSQSTISLNKRVTISPSAPRIDSLHVTGKQNKSFCLEPKIICAY